MSWRRKKIKGHPEISETYAFYEEHTAETISSPWISICSSLLADTYVCLSCNFTLKAKFKRCRTPVAEQKLSLWKVDYLKDSQEDASVDLKWLQAFLRLLFGRL